MKGGRDGDERRTLRRGRSFIFTLTSPILPISSISSSRFFVFSCPAPFAETTDPTGGPICLRHCDALAPQNQPIKSLSHAIPPSFTTPLPGPAPTAEAPITGPTADVFLAALTAAEAATKLIKAGNTNQQGTDAVAKVAEAYGVNAMQGTLMHQMKRYASDTGKEGGKEGWGACSYTCVCETEGAKKGMVRLFV